MGFQPQRLEGASGFQTQQATTDDHATLALFGGGADGFEVFDGAVDETFMMAAAGDRRHPGVGAGGQDQGIVLDDSALVGMHLPLLDIDLLDRFVEQHADPLLLVEAGLDQGELLAGVMGEIGGEVYPVIGQTGLGAKDGDLELARIAALTEFF